MKIRAALASHLKWKAHVQITLRDLKPSKTLTGLSIIHTECGFGKWYYSEGLMLSKLSHFKDLEIPHEMLHESYLKIYTLKRAKLPRGLFVNKQEVLSQREKDISLLLENLNDYSKIISETIKQLEIEVLNMNDLEISKLNE